MTPEEAAQRYNALGWETGIIEQRARELCEAEGKILMDAKKFFPNGRGHKKWLQSLKTCPATTSGANYALWQAGYLPNGAPSPAVWRRNFQRLLNTIDDARWPEFRSAIEKLIAEFAQPEPSVKAV